MSHFLRGERNINVVSNLSEITLTQEINFPEIASNLNIYKSPRFDIPYVPIGGKLVQNGAVYRMCYTTEELTELNTLMSSDTDYTFEATILEVNSPLVGGFVTFSNTTGSIITKNDPRFVGGRMMLAQTDSPSIIIVIQLCSHAEVGDNTTFTWRMGVNGSVGFVVGDVISIVSSPYVVKKANNSNPRLPIGTSQLKVNEGSYLWVQSKGPSPVISTNNNTSIGDKLTTSSVAGEVNLLTAISSLVYPLVGLQINNGNVGNKVVMCNLDLE